MSDALLALHNLQPRAQRLIAVALLILVVLVAACPVFFYVAAIQSLRSNIADNRVALGRLEQFLHTVGPDRQATSSALPDPFLHGQTIALVQADLQGKITALARSRDILPTSISNADPLTVGDVGLTGVHALFQGSLPAFNQLIVDLESANPPLLIKDAAIRSTLSASDTTLHTPLILNAEISVYGVLDPALQPAAVKPRP